MSVGENIFNLRKKFGLSQEELANKVLVSRQTISLWETDQTLPTVDNFIRLREIFNVPIDKILNDDNITNGTTNANSLDTICGTLCYALGVEPPKYAKEKNFELTNYIDKAFGNKKVDRVVMYNPDAIAEWLYKKYPDLLKQTKANSDVEIPLASVMPSVTPVCFATMYTGAQPEIHGIQKYEKPVITIETIFDALIKAGKKPALITYAECSLSKIFLERKMDYYHFPIGSGGIEAVNAKAIELILKDQHDFIVIYNGNYDSTMHKNGPEGLKSLAELRANDHFFGILSNIIKTHWKHHNVLVGFAMDHGCHEIDGGCGSHGLDMPEDINIVHFYKAYPKDNSLEKGEKNNDDRQKYIYAS